MISNLRTETTRNQKLESIRQALQSFVNKALAFLVSAAPMKLACEREQTMHNKKEARHIKESSINFCKDIQCFDQSLFTSLKKSGDIASGKQKRMKTSEKFEIWGCLTINCMQSLCCACLTLLRNHFFLLLGNSFFPINLSLIFQFPFAAKTRSMQER